MSSNCCTFLLQGCHLNSSNSISLRPPGWLPRLGPRTTGATPLRRSILPSTATSTTGHHTAPRPLTRATIPLLITSRTGALLRPTIGATTTIPTGKCKGFSRFDQCTRMYCIFYVVTRAFDEFRLIIVIIIYAGVHRHRGTIGSSTTPWPPSTPPWRERTRPGIGTGRGKHTGQLPYLFFNVVHF